jgi:fumarate reductase subunit C
MNLSIFPLQGRGGCAVQEIPRSILVPRRRVVAHKSPNTLQRFLNFLENTLEVFQQIVIFKSNDCDANLFEISSPAPLIFIHRNGKMPRSVEFDRHPAFRTIEVDNVATNAMLSTKFLSKQLSSVDSPPKDSFCGR